MKYYVIRIFTKAEKETKSITSYETEREAQVRFHSALAADLADNDITTAVEMLIDGNGNTLLKEIVTNEVK